MQARKPDLLSIVPPKFKFQMRLDYQARRLGRKPGARSHTPHNIMAEIQVHAGIELVHLHGLCFGVPLQVRTNAGVLLSKGYARGGLESPAIANSGPVQRFREHWIEVKLVSANATLQNRGRSSTCRVSDRN